MRACNGLTVFRKGRRLQASSVYEIGHSGQCYKQFTAVNDVFSKISCFVHCMIAIMQCAGFINIYEK
jgi:hypothetical protein